MLLRTFSLTLMFITIFSCKSKNEREFFENNKDKFVRLHKIFSENYDSFKSIDTTLYHNHISLNATKFKQETVFLRNGDLEFVNKCFDDKIIKYIEIYSRDCISFTISEQNGGINYNIEYIVYCNDIEYFLKNISHFSEEVSKNEMLGNNWYYLKRKASLAN